MAVHRASVKVLRQSYIAASYAPRHRADTVAIDVWGHKQSVPSHELFFFFVDIRRPIRVGGPMAYVRHAGLLHNVPAEAKCQIFSPHCMI